jgi:zinc protease
VSVFGHIRNRPETEAGPQQQGVAQLLDPLLDYGSEQLDRLAFQSALDEIGADEHPGTDFDVEVLSQDFDRGVALLADNQLHPALPAAAMAVVSKQLVQIVAARNRSPGYLTQRSLRAALFPPDDPSLREATPEGVRALSLDDVRAYYRRVFRPDLTTIVVIGHISPEQARATIEKYFGEWSADGPKPDTDLPQVPVNGASSVAVPDASRVQDNVILAQNLALTRSDPDFYALELGSAVLGGGFYSTRLSIEMRKNTGLVYSVGSTLQAGRTRGAYYIQYACDPQNVGKAANIAVQELRSMQSAAVGDDELLRVKALLLRQIPLAEASIEGIAHGLIERRDLDLPLDEPWLAARRYIQLTPVEVQAAFNKWMRPDDLVRVTQGPAPQ